MKQIISILLIACILLTVGGCNQKSTDSHESYYNQLVGGFFYTCDDLIMHKEQLNYISQRKDTINTFKDVLIDIYTDSVQLIESYQFYEDQLLNSLAQATVSNEDTLVIQEVLNSHIAHKASMTATEELIQTYLNATPTNDVTQAVIDSYLFESIYTLFDLHMQYISLLPVYSAVASIVIEPNNAILSDELITTSQSILINTITPLTDNMINDYIFANDIYAHIATADYYMAQTYLADAKRKLDKLKSTEDVLTITQLCDAQLANTQKPDYLVDVSNAVVSSTHNSSFIANPFITIAYADEYDNYANAIAAINLIGNLRKGSFEGALVVMAEDIKEIKDGLMTIGDPILDTLKTMNQPKDMAMVYVAFLPQIKQIRAQKAREEAINKINLAQGAVMGAGVASLFSDNPDAQYNTLISILADALSKNNGRFDPDKLEQFNNFLTNDLGDILGDKKQLLVQTFLNNKAENLVNIFNEWKIRTDSFTNLDFNINDITELLDKLGFGDEDIQGLIDDFNNIQVTETETPTTSGTKAFNSDGDTILVPQPPSIPDLESQGYAIEPGDLADCNFHEEAGEFYYGFRFSKEGSVVNKYGDTVDVTYKGTIDVVVFNPHQQGYNTSYDNAITRAQEWYNTLTTFPKENATKQPDAYSSTHFSDTETIIINANSPSYAISTIYMIDEYICIQMVMNVPHDTYTNINDTMFYYAYDLIDSIKGKLEAQYQ